MKKLILDILEQSLKRDGKWSSTLLTMFAFSVSVILYGWVDFILHGFNSEVFWAYVSLASGIKLTDAISKKVKPTLQ